MTLHANFIQILLIWHDIACGFHPNIFDLAYDIAKEFRANNFDLAWYCMGISSTYFWSGMDIAHKIHPSTLIYDIAFEFHPSTLAHGIHCMWNIIHILWPQWHCMCFSNGHCELRCRLQNLQMYINFPSYLGVLKKKIFNKKVWLMEYGHPRYQASDLHEYCL